MEHWVGFDAAPRIAAALLGSDSRRYEHVEGVARAAEAASSAVDAKDHELLVAAAWLHDIGYAAAVVDTGFHPLDGARYLRSIGAPDRLCRLVAHHTASAIEAEARGLLHELLLEFQAEDSSAARALTFADMTTGPDGSPIDAVQRVEEILARYPEDHVVHQSIAVARLQLLRTVSQVRADLVAATATPRAAEVDFAYLSSFQLQLAEREPDGWQLANLDAARTMPDELR